MADILPNPQHALWTIVVSHVLWKTGFVLAMVVLVIYFHRLAIHHLSPRQALVSIFPPSGPLGQDSVALMQLGKVAKREFPLTETLDPTAGATFYNFGHVCELITWSYGLL